MTDRPARDAATLAAVEAATLTAATVLVATHDKVALSYSGGAESGLLLHLLRPLRQHLVVLYVNPGALPHEVDHVHRQTADWPRFVEMGSDRRAFWAAHGLPTWLLPQAHDPATTGDQPSAEPKLTLHWHCCQRVRTAPADDWCRAHGVTLMIHGQRRGERSNLFRQATIPPQWGPLADWTRGEVMARVAHHGIPLPRQYAEGYPHSFECAVCPADTDPDRLTFLRRHYPAEHAETVALMRTTLEPAEATAAAIRATVDRETTATTKETDDG